MVAAPWALRDAIRAGAAIADLAPDLAAIAARTLALEARDRHASYASYASIDELRRAIAAAGGCARPRPRSISAAGSARIAGAPDGGVKPHHGATANHRRAVSPA